MTRLRIWLVLAVLTFGFVGLSIIAVQAQEPPDPPRTSEGNPYLNLSDLPTSAFAPLPLQQDRVVAPPMTVLGGTTVYTDRTTFTAEFPSLTYETFETNSCTGITGFPAPLNAYTATTCYHRGQIHTGIELRDNPLNDTGGGSANGLAFVEGGTNGVSNDAVVANTFTNTFELYLTPTVTALGLDLTSVTTASPLRVRVYGADSTLIHESTFPSVGPSGAFIGFYEAAGIRRIELFANNGATGNGAEGLSGLLFGSPGMDITLQKTVGTDPNSCAPTDTINVAPGTNVTYCYTVTNNTATTLSMHTLTDTSQGPLLTDVRNTLPPGASFAYTTSQTILTTTVSGAEWDVQVPLDYNIITGTCTFPNISGTGTALNLTDDGEANVTMPFKFPFYDIYTDMVRVSNNGVVLFGNTTSEVPFENLPLATTNFRHAAVPFWDDLDDESGNVYVGVYTYTFASDVEPNLVAPSAVTPRGNIVYYVVMWANRPHHPGPNANTATLAVAFAAPGQGFDGYMFSCYQDIVFGDATLDNGSSATIGLNQYSSGADQFSFNTSHPELNGSNGIGFQVLNPGARYTATDSTTVNVINPDIQVAPAMLDVTHTPAPQSTLHTLTITNTGNVVLSWNITEAVDNCAAPTDVDWLSISTTNGNTPPGNGATNTVLLNSLGLAPAIYNAQLCITSNDPDTPLVIIPIALTVQTSPITPTPTPTQGPSLTDRLYLPLVKRR